MIVLRKRRQFLRLLATRYQVKIAFSYLAIIALILLLINTYPIVVAQNFIYATKEASLLNRAGLIAARLGGPDMQTPGDTNMMKSLEQLIPSRAVVTDAEARVLYDSVVTAPATQRYVLQPEIICALQGNDVFTSRYSTGAFESRTAVPIFKGDGEVVIGAVYLYEYDVDQAKLLSSLQKNLATISLIVAAVVILLSILLSAALSRRISDLLRGIRLVRAGEHSHRVPRRGQDELGDLADEFNELTDRIQKNENLRRQFVSDASHELKTPLASIRVLADSIIQTKDMDVELIREFVADIGEESSRLTRMTEKLLTLARLDAVEPMETPPGPVAIDTVIARALRRLQPLAEQDQVELCFDMIDSGFVRGDEDDLFQIVFNLVENAVKYNRPNGIVDIKLTVAGGKVVMTVADTGVGIPVDQIDHVFDRFFRVDKTRSRQAGGAGLGLSIVKDAIERHGGEIQLASRRDEGTLVTVSFPIFAPEEGEAG